MCFKALFPLSLLLLLIVTGCSDSDTDIERGVENSQTIVEGSKSRPIEEESAASIAARVKDNLTDVVLALSGDGLSLINEQSGKTQTIPFDTDIATSIATISSTLGEPTEKSQNSECGAGSMRFITWSNGLTINAIGRTVCWLDSASEY